MHVADSIAGAAALVAFERRLLVTAADRIARAPSLWVKMFLCRIVVATASRVHALQRLLPDDVARLALSSRPDPESEQLLDVLGSLEDEAAFVTAFQTCVVPFARSGYAAVGDATTAATAVYRVLRRAIRTLRALERSRALARRTYGRVRQAAVESRLARHGLGARLVTGMPLTLGARNVADRVTRTAPEIAVPARERVIAALRVGEVGEDTWFVGSPAEHHRYLHQLIAFEINTFEAVSRHIAEFAWMPWEFHWDMASQIHDELRHLEMWLERLPHVGGRLGAHALNAHEFTICTGHDLPGRLAVLERLVESAALDGLELNRCLWESRDDAVMVAYLSRVQLDEIRHVRIGNKWLRRLCPDADLVALVDRVEAATRARMLHAAQALEANGVVSPGNVELMRRKFDDPLCLTMDYDARIRAGFTDEELAREAARRRALLQVTNGGGCDDERRP